MRKSLSILIIFSCVVLSCKNENKLEQEIAKIDVDVNIERFDQLFAQTQPENLANLKQAYPFMFPKRYHDSIWIERINDTLQQQLSVEVNKVHGSLAKTTDAVNGLFQHLGYYFKEFKTPRVITVTNFVDYRNRTIVTDSIALIALDNYLGGQHEFYIDIYDYIKQNLNKSQIVPDLAKQYAEKRIFQAKRKTLLDEMIYHGKVLYFKEVMLNNTANEDIIGYSKEDLDWAQVNESNIWRHFVEKELLFSTDTKLPSRFINPAPFSKFYLEFDAESPGRLGQYMGWQIVRAYMQNNTVSLQEMLHMEAEEIFTNSKFKPRK
jgi:gliding motility-associated lipoprotein GldB